MNKLLILLIALSIACNSSEKKIAIATTAVLSSFIPIDSANRMTASLQESFGTYHEDSLQYFSLDADELRQYLANNEIAEIKIVLGHNLDYINSGNFGKPAGLSPNALTVWLQGFTVNGGPVYFGTNEVLNRAKPCPPICL